MHTPHFTQKMTAATFCPNVTGGTSGSSVSSTVGMPVTKSISCGLHTRVRFATFHPKYSAAKSGMLMYDVRNPDALKAKNTSKPLMRMKSVIQKMPQYDSHGCSGE